MARKLAFTCTLMDASSPSTEHPSPLPLLPPGTVMDKRLAPKIDIPENMLQLYERTWLPFGELLTDMEAEGVKVERPHLAQVGREAVMTSKRHQHNLYTADHGVLI